MALDVLSVVAWKWKRPDGSVLFGPEYVNRLRSMFERHLHVPHEIVCVTDDSTGVDPRVRIVPMPTEFNDTPRCRRRMWQYSKERRTEFGSRMLAVDLDVVVVDNITPIVDRPEPVVCWRVGYADVFSGSFLLCNVGALHGAWLAFSRNPAGYMKATRERNASDQAMVNMYLEGRPVAEWTERDGFVTWFGDGYAKLERHGMGPGRTALPPGARIVVLGSADKRVMDEQQHEFVREHWR